MTFLKRLDKRLEFKRAIDVVEFAAARLGFSADEKQAEVLRWKAKRAVLACSRQWGKSTTAAVKAVHRAYTEPGSLVLVASPSERQSAEFLGKVEGFVRRLGIQAKGDGWNELSVKLPNGSRIVGLPGTEATVRGFSAVSLLMVDEASRVPDEVYKALRPMLAVKDGDLWLMSTPYGKRGFFYEAWAYGEEWSRMAVRAPECPRIQEEFLREELRVLGEAWFRQEYLCEFVDNGAGLFERDVVEGAVSEEVPELEL